MSSVRSSGRSTKSISSRRSARGTFLKPTFSSMMKQKLAKAKNKKNLENTDPMCSPAKSPFKAKRQLKTGLISPLPVSKRLRSSSRSNSKSRLSQSSGKKPRLHENLELASEVKKRDVKAIDKSKLDELIKVPFKELNRNEKPIGKFDCIFYPYNSNYPVLWFITMSILEAPAPAVPSTMHVNFTLDTISNGTGMRCPTIGGKSSVASCNISLLQSVNGSGRSTPILTPYKMMRMTKENTANNIDKLEFKILELEKQILKTKAASKDEEDQNEFLDGVSQIDASAMIKENLDHIQSLQPKEAIMEPAKTVEPIPEFSTVLEEVESEKPEVMAKPKPKHKSKKSKSKSKHRSSKKAAPKQIKSTNIEIIEINDSESEKPLEVAEPPKNDKFDKLDTLMADTLNLINDVTSEHNSNKSQNDEPEPETAQLDDISVDENVPVIEK